MNLHNLTPTATLAAIKTQTDKIGTNDADSPNARVAQTAVGNGTPGTVGGLATCSVTSSAGNPAVVSVVHSGDCFDLAAALVVVFDQVSASWAGDNPGAVTLYKTAANASYSSLWQPPRFTPPSGQILPPPLAPGGYNLYWSSADGAWPRLRHPDSRGSAAILLGVNRPERSGRHLCQTGHLRAGLHAAAEFSLTSPSPSQRRSPSAASTPSTRRPTTCRAITSPRASRRSLPRSRCATGGPSSDAAGGRGTNYRRDHGGNHDYQHSSKRAGGRRGDVPGYRLGRVRQRSSGPLRWTEPALALSPSASLPIGPGGISVAIVVKDTNGNPLADVDSWITSDSAGATTIAGTLETNSLGSVAFMLNAGVNYLWRMSPTYNFPNPQRITVEGSSMSITFADGTVITGPVSGYAVRSDLENIFGIPNIIKWAILSANDPDSPAGLAEITARINWAIGVATVDFENAMRQGRYTLPITGTGASVWATTVVATLAGLLLYQHLKPTQRDQDGRPIPDRYDGIFTWAEQQMNFVRSGKLRLDAAVFGKGTNAPEATHERSRGAYGPGIGGYGTGPFPPPGPFVG